METKTTKNKGENVNKRKELARSTIVASQVLFGIVCFLISIDIFANAGRYDIEKGYDVPVCEEYKKNLNSFELKQPMQYVRKINPSYKKLSKPEWINYLENPPPIPVGVNIHSAVDAYLWETAVNPIGYYPYSKWSSWRSTTSQLDIAKENFLKNRDSKRTLSPIKYAVIDIDNDGMTEPVWFDAGRSHLLLVLTPDWVNVDIKKTALITAHKNYREYGYGELRTKFPKEPDYISRNTGLVPVADALSYAYYDVFLYKGKTYIDLWWTRHPDYKGENAFTAGRLHVYSVESGKLEEKCTYKFSY